MTSGNGADLRRQGWAKYDKSHVIEGLNDRGFEDSLEVLCNFFIGLPPDRYEPTVNRYRRHDRAVYLPWKKSLDWLPNPEDPEYGLVVDYDMQGYNSEFSDLKRQYPAIPVEIRENPLLKEIVRFDLEQTMWLDGFARTPLNVGVGCVMLSVEDEASEAASTPNMLHQDGGAVAFTFVHLIFRQNVIGGENFIAPPRCVGFLPTELSPDMIQTKFTLEEPLDAFGVHNSRVSHHVNSVRRGHEPHAGRRCALIVAISPLVKQL